jgi:hypothetical protein
MSGLAARTSIALFTAVVFLLFQSVFWASGVPIAIKAVLTGVVVLSFFRPLNGLLVLAALAPLAGAWSPLVGGGVRGAEALVLAFLAGSLLRGWTLHQFRRVPSDRLQIAAAVFGAIVGASSVHQLWLSGVDGRDVLSRVAGYYLISTRGLGMVFNAMLFLEGLALLAFVVHYCRTRPLFPARLLRMLMFAAIGAAALNFVYFANELLDTGQPAGRLVEFFVGRRWSAHVGDVNAAGSFFAMMLAAALGVAMKNRTHRIPWGAAAVAVGLALWMTASRSALTGVLVVVLVYAAMRVLAAPASRLRSIAVVVGACIVVAVIATRYLPGPSPNASPSRALNIRWLFLQTTWRMVEAHPFFGVGIGQYARSSTQFSSPELLASYVRENAHNNFAQVAGELGLVGLSAFTAVLTVSLWTARSTRLAHPLTGPVLAGLAAFIISWLGGHPLLVPEVAYPFWMMLGIVPGLSFDIISEPYD